MKKKHVILIPLRLRRHNAILFDLLYPTGKRSVFLCLNATKISSTVKAVDQKLSFVRQNIYQKNIIALLHSDDKCR